MKPFVIALAILVLPLAAGVAAGRFVRRRRDALGRRYPLVCAGVAVTVVIAALVSSVFVLALGVWDQFLIAFLFVAAFLISAIRSPADSSSVRLAAVSAAIALAAGEIVVRTLFPAPYDFPPVRDARLTFPKGDREEACNAIYLDALREHPPREERKTVLHVGDSMVAGVGVERSRAWVNLLNEADPGASHENLGMAGAGPDAYWLAARARIARSRVDAIVTYVFLGNDIADMDKSYVCCGAGPLLEYGASVPEPRCPEPIWSFPYRFLLARSPAPYALRVATSFSHLARRATHVIMQSAARIERPEALWDRSRSAPVEDRWRHIGAVIDSMSAELSSREIRLLVVLLPYRRALVGAGGEEARDWSELDGGYESIRVRMRSILEAKGIDYIDLHDRVESAIERDGGKAWFARAYPGDVHFSEHGHREVAAWMRTILVDRGL